MCVNHSCARKKSPYDCLWAAVWPLSGRSRVPAPLQGLRPDLGRCSRICEWALPALLMALWRMKEKAGKMQMPHPPVMWTAARVRQRQPAGGTVLPTHGWGKQSIWLAASGSQTLFAGRSPHPLFHDRRQRLTSTPQELRHINKDKSLPNGAILQLITFS